MKSTKIEPHGNYQPYTFKNLFDYCVPLIRASGELSSESIDGYGDVREVCVC